MNEIPLEEAEPARKAFGDLTEGEREVVRAALAVIARDPAVGREIPGRRSPSVEYTYVPHHLRTSAGGICQAEQTRALHAHLRWRNANSRHPGLLAVQHEERARIRRGKGIRWGSRPMPAQRG